MRLVFCFLELGNKLHGLSEVELAIELGVRDAEHLGTFPLRPLPGSVSVLLLPQLLDGLDERDLLVPFHFLAEYVLEQFDFTQVQVLVTHVTDEGRDRSESSLFSTGTSAPAGHEFESVIRMLVRTNSDWSEDALVSD